MAVNRIKDIIGRNLFTKTNLTLFAQNRRFFFVLQRKNLIGLKKLEIKDLDE
jgi:hypothetical protein